MKKHLLILAVVCGAVLASCGDKSEKSTTEKTTETSTSTTATPPPAEPAAPASKWPGKAAFIDSCANSEGIKGMTKGDAAKAKSVCSCIADKVEAKYPAGLGFEEAGKNKILMETGADKCMQ